MLKEIVKTLVLILDRNLILIVEGNVKIDNVIKLSISELEQHSNYKE